MVKKAIRKSDGRVFAIKVRGRAVRQATALPSHRSLLQIVDKRKLNPDELAVIHDEVTIMYKASQRP